MTDDDIVAAAQVIRPYLPALVGPAADQLDTRVGDLLNRPRDEAVITGLRAVLESEEVTRDFVAEVIDDAPLYRPPGMQRGGSRQVGFQPLAGDVRPVGHTGRFTCPRGDYTWFRASIGTPVPTCPTHHLELRIS